MTSNNNAPVETSDNNVATAHPMQPLQTAPAPALAANGQLSGMPVLRVFGVGGGGCNAVGRMCEENLGVVEYFGINTDSQHLDASRVGNRIPSSRRGFGLS